MGNPAVNFDIQRAEHALKIVQSLQNQPFTFRSKYVSYVESLPAQIITNGLGQAMATLLASAKGKKEDPHYVLYQNLQEWLCKECKDAPYAGKKDLIKAVVKGDRDQYLRAQHEALAWLEWHKKLSVAYLLMEESGEPENSSSDSGGKTHGHD